MSQALKSAKAIAGENITDTHAMIECALRISGEAQEDDSKTPHVRAGLSGLLANVQRARVLEDDMFRWLASVALQRIIDGIDERGAAPIESWAGRRGRMMVAQGIDMLRSLTH